MRYEECNARRGTETALNFPLSKVTRCGKLIRQPFTSTISLGQPGFLGRLDIGGFPPPQVIYQQSQLIYLQTVLRPPIYLHVSPGQAKNW
jgi:hypothetical protein